MQLTPELQKEYQELYRNCKIESTKLSQVDTIINRMMDNRTRYKKVERVTDVPWYIIAVIHQLESSGNFNTHLHNGNPLSAKTTDVPRNRPLGEPPFTWEESAQDALE